MTALVALLGLLFFGVAAGFSMLGQGGGVLYTPIQVIAGIDFHVASGHWDWKTSLLLGVAVFVGGQIGSRKSVTLDKKKIKPVFGWFLVGVAILMAVRALI